MNLFKTVVLLFFSLFLVVFGDSSGIISQNQDSGFLSKPTLNLATTREKARQALEFCKKNKMDTTICILIDMSLHSGIKRFIVWDFKNDTIQHLFLVGHGCCDNMWSYDQSKDSPQFSNVDGSHCSSLGKYRLGKRGYSNWGVHINYQMHGLESSNSNANKRLICFHSWEVVSDSEVYPDGTPEGWGCPTISNNSFKLVDPILQKTNLPVLMWIYQ